MKKSNIILGLIILFGLFQLIVPIYYPDFLLNPNTSPLGILLAIIIFLGLFMLGMYYKLEESAISTKEISLIAIYCAFTAVARIPFVVLPSVQPCSYLIFCAGFVFGPLIGFIIGANTAFLSNFILGQGPWTIYQMFGWGMIGIVGGILNLSKDRQPNKWLNASIGFILGFFYGWLLNLWFWVLFIKPLTWESWILVNITCFYLDLSHAICNALFLYYFGDRTINILYRYKQRFLFTVEEIQIFENPIDLS
ncbi:MAG: ECF transporter S component [Promethearchaeota archaeon]